MSGTPEGGRKSAETLLSKNPNHFSDLARRSLQTRGGKPTPGSFDSETGAAAGKRGGKVSKRGKGKAADGDNEPVGELKL